MTEGLPGDGAASQVRTARNGSVLEIAMARPDKGNAVGVEMADQLHSALSADLEGIGCVLVTGDGPNFCVGGDVAEFMAAADPKSFLTALAHSMHRTVRILADGDVPVVTAVNGWATGIGMSLVCGSDIAVAGRGARFRAAYRAVGLSPDGGMSWLLPRLIGTARSMDLLLTDRTLSASEAERIGLVSRVVEDDDVLETARELAASLAAGPRLALARTRRLIRDGATVPLAEQLDVEAWAIGYCADSAGSRKRVAAFVSRNK